MKIRENYISEESFNKDRNHGLGSWGHKNSILKYKYKNIYASNDITSYKLSKEELDTYLSLPKYKAEEYLNGLKKRKRNVKL